MFYHIIMKNFKSNLKNYILFFVSNILAIAELFAFWGLNDVVKKAVKDGVTAATLKSDFVLAAGLITFITVFLMIFSMKYYMKLRIKDYTTFIVLGMKKKTSYLLLLVEYTVGCVFSLVFGILMGNGILYGAQTALHKLYPEFLKVTAPGWKIYRNTCGMSVANMTGVYVLSYEWRCASKDAGSLDVTFWMYWILIVGIYLLADRLVQWLFAQYVIKRVEKGND